MDGDNEKLRAMFGSLVSAVVHAMTGGSDDDRKRLAVSLRGMESEMPGVSGETADAKEFLVALIDMLEGRPSGAEELPEPFGGIYRGILAKAAGAAGGAGGGTDRDTREFLTGLCAAVVLVVRNGADDEADNLAGRLRSVRDGMPEDRVDERAFIVALIGLLKGEPVHPDSLAGPYPRIYRKLLAEVGAPLN